MIPAGAQKIIDARSRGFKPSELILVSLIGRINEPNPTVYARPGQNYDWRWVRGLKVCVYADETVNWKPTLIAIAKERPEWLALWDMPGAEGAEAAYLPNVDDLGKPRHQWRWDIYFQPWVECENKAFAGVAA